MARTEPNKEQNEAAIRLLKRETRGPLPLKYTDARAGATSKERTTGRGDQTYFEHGYAVRALDDTGQSVEVAFFPLDDFDEGRRRDTARILAEELAERLNEA